MKENPSQLLQPGYRINDWVQVRSLAEIMRTLDDQGTLAGLPMMPEMARFCGQRFQIARFVNKVCANVGTIEIRELHDTVVLQMDRCDGSQHGGCQMACDFLWKLDWIQTADQTTSDREPDHALGTAATGANLEKLTRWANQPDSRIDNPKSTGRCFRCQATQLEAASRQSSPFHFNQYQRDRRLNGRSWWQIVTFLGSAVFKKIFKRTDGWSGPHRRTPVAELGLQVGDQVKVKSAEEILQTLDQKGCNRGLWFDPAEMAPFCGRTMTVTRVIHQFIDETTGELLETSVPSIVLGESRCSGQFRRFCGRGMLHFWREVWLEKLDRGK